MKKAPEHIGDYLAKVSELALSCVTPLMSKSLSQQAYQGGQRYLDLYRDWELHLDDFVSHFEPTSHVKPLTVNIQPASYRAIVEHPRFEGGIHLHGQYYDEKTLRAIYTKFPTWNATLHDVRAPSLRK